MRLLLGGMAGLVMGAALPLAASAAPATPRDDRARGMVWDGLAPGHSGHRCQGGFEIRGRADDVLGCTHGPDPAPAGIDPRVAVGAGSLTANAAALPVPTPAPGTNADGIACAGDGTSGYRVEAIYAIAGPTGARPDRFQQVAPLIRSSYAPFVEWQARSSAVETGGEAHVPFVTEPTATGCTLVVRHEVLTTSGADSFSNTITELKARGYNRTDRRYMVWMDASVLCGIGQLYVDSQPGQTNANNGAYTAFARVDAACWGYGEGHELMHTIGAAQPDAPHGTAGFHCWDQNDVMCYDDDGPGPVVMRPMCPGRDSRLFDCGHDDYFRAGAPPAGSWLAAHWNTYDSRFLLRGPAPTSVPAASTQPPVIGGSTWYSDGTRTASGPAGVVVRAYATGAIANVPYRLVLATAGCRTVVGELNPAMVYAGPTGLLGRVQGTIPSGLTPATYTVCFRNAAGTTATAGATFNLTSPGANAHMLRAR
jgi:hypothetical protein